MTALGVALLAIGSACGILRLVRTFRKRWPRLDQGIAAFLGRSRWGLLFLVLARNWVVAFAFLSMGLKALGVIPTWTGALAFGALGVAVAATEIWRQFSLENRAFEALRAHRRSIRADLAEARTRLTAAGEGTVQGHLARFDQWMLSGELESAFDELEAAGGILACPPKFWLVLRGAAEKLGLAEEAARIDKRLGPHA